MTLNHRDARSFAACEAIICDLDGTLYLDKVAIRGAKEFLYGVIESGKRLFYFTNNTSASRRTWLDKLAGFGFPAQDDFLITSADCAEAYLRRNGLYPRIYLVGNQELRTEFAARGFTCLTEQEALEEAPQAVLLGFDTELNYEKISTCYTLIQQNVPYIATHADILCPVGRNTFKPDVGSFIALFETATNGRRPVVVGKPSKEAVRFISEKAGTTNTKMAFIGDRLYTDIRMAVNTGMLSILVLSGETTRAMLQQSSDKPHMVVNSVADLASYL